MNIEPQSLPASLVTTSVDEPSGRTSTYATRTFQVLDYRFAVRGGDAVLVNLVDRLYGPCSVPGSPDAWYSVAYVGPETSEQSLFVGDSLLASFPEPSWLMRYLAWHVNGQVIARSSRFVLIHAAVAEKQGAGVLLPAASESGKTTLVAGLIRSGFGYLTDEAAAIHPETLEVEPYPKPLAIDPGSWSVLSELAPGSSSDTAQYLEGQWQVNADSIRPDAVSERVKPALVVFPKYVEGAGLEIEPVTRSAALVMMMQHTFNVHEAGRRNLEVLGRMLRHTKCYRMVSGDLDEACAAIESLVAFATTGEGRG